MAEPTLAEVAADVAAALRLVTTITGSWYYSGRAGDKPWLRVDGSDLTDPYWRCACEDWLLARGALTLASVPSGLLPDRHGCLLNDGVDAWIDFCPWPEAPARLVSAVHRMQAGKIDVIAIDAQIWRNV